MPLATPTYIVPVMGWSGGINRDDLELALEMSETPSCLNVDIDNRGSFKPRQGYARYDTGPTAVGVALGQHRVGPPADTDTLIYVGTDGDVWADVDASLVDVTATLGAPANSHQYFVSIASLNKYTYVSSTRGNTWRYDGTTWLEITDGALNGSGTAGTPEFPRVLAMVSYKNRIFAGNIVASGSVVLTSRIAWSTLITDEGGNKWEAASFIDVDPDDGDQVWALQPFGGQLLIFKERAIWSLAGDDEDSFTLYNISPQIGTEAGHSVAVEEGNLFFFDTRRGVYRFDGVTPQRIDDKIHNYLMDGVNKANAYKSHGFVRDGRYYLSVPWGASTVPDRTFVYDVSMGAWWEYDYGVTDSIVYKNRVYTVGNKNAAGVFKFNQSDVNDNGSSFPWNLDTVWLPPPEQQGMTVHRLRRLDIFSEADSSSYTVAVYLDGDTATAASTQTVDGTTTRTPLLGYGELWSIMKLRFSGTVT